MDDLKTRIEVLEEKTKKNPGHKELYYWLGQSYEMLEEDTKAKQNYLEYLVRDIGFSNRDQAVDYLEKEIKSNPENRMAFINLGQIYCYLNRFDEAEEMLKKGTCWEAFESRHYFYHVIRDSIAFRQLERIKELWENNFRKIEKSFGESFDLKIKYFFYESAVHKGMVTGDQELGHCLVEKKEVHIVFNQMYRVSSLHEDCHAVLHHIGNPIKLFDEGTALYLDQGKDMHARFREVEDNAYSLAALLDDETFEHKNLYIVYPQVGSFVGFLWEAYGGERIKQACRYEIKTDACPRVLFEAVFGKTLDQLEKEWKEFIDFFS